jgi:hypothetical protein
MFPSLMSPPAYLPAIALSSLQSVYMHQRGQRFDLASHIADVEEVKVNAVLIRAKAAGENVGSDCHQCRMWRRDRRTTEDGTEQGEKRTA